ncbi:hypothetical protein [Lacticaseibacillus camelliae]|uniref:hypothetical protein n=1 Tax=Lacticaseibacillus camelliae TaxID=381742 RepID=UPI0006D0400D|nr:hypothetical protein [Lacticaseibacillus camelliae]
MASEYRLTDPADRERFYQLYLYAFNGQDSEARRRFFNARYAHGWIYGLKKWPAADLGALQSAIYR